MLEQESAEGARWRTGEIEEEGRTKIETPTMNDDGDDQALLGFEGRLEGATIAPITIPVQPLPRSPPPAPPKANVELSRALQLPQPPENRVSPIFWVGEHEYDMRQASPCPGRRASALHPHLRDSCPPSCPHAIATAPLTSPPPFSISGNPTVRSVFFSDVSIAMKTAPTLTRPFSPYQRRPDRCDNAGTVRFGPQDAYPLDDHPCYALR